jgi:phospholipid/cholesterol/gamma-HCH transport system substrate-binding protein
MYSRVNYTIVGIFVLLFGIGMVAFSFWLAKYGLKQKYDLYQVYMRESVAGLSKDSVVRLRGVDIGRVKEIRIDPHNIEQVKILLQIKEGTPIKEDMVVHTTMLGVTGLLAIEIDGGTNSARTLKPSKKHIPVLHSSASWFEETKKNIGTLADRLSEAVVQTEKLLSDDNIETFGKILKNTEALTLQSSSLFDEINSTVIAYRQAVQKFNDDLDRVSSSFVSLSNETMPTVKKLMETSRNFNRLTLKVERSLDRGDYNLKKIFEPILVDIEILSEQIDETTRKLDASPSDILFKSRKTRYGPGEQ